MWAKYAGGDGGVPCPWFAEGTVPMYCMAVQGGPGGAKLYKDRLKKAAPGDNDLGHFCGSTPLQALKDVLDDKGGGEATQLFQSPGGDFISVKESATSVRTNLKLDVHSHGSKARYPAQVGDTSNVPDFCLCDGVCEGMPLVPLGVDSAFYQYNERSKDKSATGGNKKMDFIKFMLSSYGNSQCGPCRAYVWAEGDATYTEIASVKYKPVAESTAAKVVADEDEETTAVADEDEETTAGMSEIERMKADLAAAKAEIARLKAGKL